jgi:hypothetical protein
MIGFGRFLLLPLGMEWYVGDDIHYLLLLLDYVIYICMDVVDAMRPQILTEFCFC